MSGMTQVETELRTELGKAEARCASWREVLRLEREHAAARLTAMTEERDAVLHGGVTEEMLRRQDGTIRLAKGCCIVIESEWDETLRQLTEAQQETARLRKMEAETWAKAAELVEWQANGIWFDHVREAYERAAKILRQQALAGTKEGA